MYNRMKEKHIFLCFDVLKQIEKLSTCASKKVACLVLKDTRIVSYGYNGTPPGFQHCNEIFSADEILANTDMRHEHHEWSSKHELHAEQNAIAFCARNGISTDGLSIFCTLSPCIDCSKLIIASGITDVYFTKLYDYNEKGLDFLHQNSVATHDLTLLLEVYT